MPDYIFDKHRFLSDIDDMLAADYSLNTDEANTIQVLDAVYGALLVQINKIWHITRKEYYSKKQTAYLCLEFLVGRGLANCLVNLNIYDDVCRSLKEKGLDLKAIEDVDPDPALGNGGLGRLAACFMDSAATLGLPVKGHGILFRHGLFKQEFNDGFQVETPETWLEHGYRWLVKREDLLVKIHFSDMTIKAIPYDMPIPGCGSERINTIRLWKAEPMKLLDFDAFNDQEYDKALNEFNRCGDICRVLYPADEMDEGKRLRLRQEYFFTSACVQSTLKAFTGHHGEDFAHLGDWHSFHMNDTHPAVAVAELMRVMVDVYNVDWDTAWKATKASCSYTLHTVMQEALERWNTHLFSALLPEIYDIIVKINDQMVSELQDRGVSWKRIDKVKILDGSIVMANLAAYGSHHVNGVAQLHTKILKEHVLKDYNAIYPGRIVNETNGITPRRWLALCNPELSGLITELLGSMSWRGELHRLSELTKFADDKAVLDKFAQIKMTKKHQLVSFISDRENIALNPNTMFDMHLKRLHEYKRQLLNALRIVDEYQQLKDSPNMEFTPRTYLFGAKAAPGYFRAKGIIKFINEIAKLINGDPTVNDKMKVLYVTDYNVSYAEKLFPAADLSEQISTAGFEASGTGNMKLMLNGALTIGTMDGANVEMIDEVGQDNFFLFGANAQQTKAMKNGYDVARYYPRVKRALDTLIDGTFSDGGTGMFKELYDSILKGTSWHHPDNYFLLHDYQSYYDAQRRVDVMWADKYAWLKASFINIAGGGRFSSDATMLGYAKDIWNITPKN